MAKTTVPTELTRTTVVRAVYKYRHLTCSLSLFTAFLSGHKGFITTVKYNSNVCSQFKLFVIKYYSLALQSLASQVLHYPGSPHISQTILHLTAQFQISHCLVQTGCFPGLSSQTITIHSLHSASWPNN